MLVQSNSPNAQGFEVGRRHSVRYLKIQVGESAKENPHIVTIWLADTQHGMTNA